MKDIQKIKKIMYLFMQLDEVDKQAVTKWINSYEEYKNVYEKVMREVGLIDKLSEDISVDMDWDKYKFSDKCYEDGIMSLEEG